MSQRTAQAFVAATCCILMQELHLVHCNKIPGKAWMKLDNAKWKQLQKADFTGSLGEEE